MNHYRTLLMFMLAVYSISSALAATLTLSAGNPSITPTGDPLIAPSSELISTGGDTNLSAGNTQITLRNEYSIFVDGDLYLDYSVFSENEDLNIRSNISLSGETVNIFSFAEEPTMPDLSMTTIFRNPSLSMSQVGNVLLFSGTPVLSGMFEATNSIYIGNYSSLKPVPLPTSLVLLLSGIVAFGLRITTANKSCTDSSRRYRQKVVPDSWITPTES